MAFIILLACPIIVITIAACAFSEWLNARDLAAVRRDIARNQ